MKAGDWLICHKEMSGVSPGIKNTISYCSNDIIFTLNKRYKVLRVFDYRNRQPLYFHFLFVLIESNNGRIEFVNYEYKQWLCSIKKIRKQKLDNLKKIL